MRIRVPATSANLGPGFDCLGLALGLHNTLEVTPAGTTRLEIEGEGASELPRDETHLVRRAMDLFAERSGRPLPPVAIRQENRIPLARGLGSSSAAIVGAVVAAARLLEVEACAEDLLRLAAEVEGHPDNVAPALLGGLTVASSGESGARAIRLAPVAGVRAVVAVPDFQVATRAARQALPEGVPHADAVFNVAHAATVLAAFLTGRFELLGEALEDRLHQPYRAHLIPGLWEVIATAREAGAYGAAISGSGPSVVAFVGEGAEAVGAAMVTAFAHAGVDARALSLPVDLDGTTVEAD